MHEGPTVEEHKFPDQAAQKPGKPVAANSSPVAVLRRNASAPPAMKASPTAKSPAASPGLWGR